MKLIFLFCAGLFCFPAIEAQTNPATIKAGTQVWMQRNLNVTRYRNGDPIPRVTDPDAWSKLTTGAYCYYDNDSARYAAVYGKLYNWYAVNDPRGLAPVGWHVPSDDEWEGLVKGLGGVNAGLRMKEKGLKHWLSSNEGATNSSSFTGLPGGMRHYTGSFEDIGYKACFWSASENNTDNAWCRYLSYINGNCHGNNPAGKQSGFSVRCIKN